MPVEPPIIIATRGSALAMVQTNLILTQCRTAFPRLRFEIKIIKTTGDRLQKASMANAAKNLPKGLFTKELEVALLKGKADIAVHSLKDLPTELPDGLLLAATPQRADVRDVLIYRAGESPLQPSTREPQPGPVSNRRVRKDFMPRTRLEDFPTGTIIGTSSTRRKLALLAFHPDLNIVPIRGNVATRLQKVAGRDELDATVLALAGLTRLNFAIHSDGTLTSYGVSDGLL